MGLNSIASMYMLLFSSKRGNMINIPMFIDMSFLALIEVYAGLMIVHI